MEVSQHRPHSLKLIPRINKNIRLPANRIHRFQRPHGRRPRRHHPSPPHKLRPRHRPHHKPFLMQDILLHRSRMQRLKRPQPHMQSHPRHGRRYLPQHPRRKMQPRRRSRYAPPLPRIHGLIPLPILLPVRPLNIRRQRHMPHPLNRRPKVLGFESQNPLPVLLPPHHGRRKPLPKLNPLPHRQLLPGPHQRPPLSLVRTHRLHQKHLHPPRPPRSMPQQPRRENLRIVQYQTIGRPQVPRQFPKHPVFPRPGLPIDHQHSRPVALSRRRLSNQLVRQIIIEV